MLRPRTEAGPRSFEAMDGYLRARSHKAPADSDPARAAERSAGIEPKPTPIPRRARRQREIPSSSRSRIGKPGHAFQSRIGHPDRKRKKRRISASSSNQNAIRSATHARLFTGNLAAPSNPNRPFAAHLPPARRQIRILAACTRCRTPAFDPLRSSRT